MRQSIADLNRLSREDFVRVVGPVFEHSPWIATEAAGRRPFPSVDELHRAMCAVVRAAPPEKQLALVRAHPDLAGRAKLTAPSAREQAGAGLLELAPEEAALLQQRNAAYREKFGFPFVICARLNRKEAIVAALARRLGHSPEEELQTALEEIFKIAGLRLRDLAPA